MYKKLEDSCIIRILETAIDEFAERGLDRANMSTIARKAGVSVGVIYKYFDDKDALFLACVRHSLELLSATLSEAVEGGGSVEDCIRRLIRCLIRESREHSSYNAMYNEITSGSCRKYAGVLAEEIETGTARLYRKIFTSVSINEDADPRVFAFLFDNLLMMLQFSYSCDYYRQRMKIFCGQDILDDDERMVEAFMSFIGGAMKGAVSNA